MNEAKKEQGGTSLRRFKPYPAYKNSGVEWLREIPAHWEVRKVKRLCLVRRGASPRPIDDPIYFDENGECAWVRIADVTASQRYLERTTQRLSTLGRSKSVALEPGELFVSIAATVGKPVITKIKCCIHDGFVYFVGLHENREFLFYLFSCGEPYKGLGKLGTQLNLNTDTIGDIYLPLPSGAEEEAIVQFLDPETAKIDALVAKKDRLIELLQEKRTVLITRAVTKGLDPNVPMKESGVEWLGEIPAHWGVKPLKVVAFVKTGFAFSSDDFTNEGVPLLRIGDITRNGRIDLSDAKYLPDNFLQTNEAVIVQIGDIAMAMTGATIGKVGRYCYKTPALLNQRVCIFRPNRDNSADFLWYLLNANFYFEHVLLTAFGGAQANISDTQLLSCFVPVPPLSEQSIIAAFLDRETMKIDALMAKVHVAIDRLKELRTALISAAVTGKIDVREETA
jgi:type I restriction enzyme S subunit